MKVIARWREFKTDTHSHPILAVAMAEMLARHRGKPGLSFRKFRLPSPGYRWIVDARWREPHLVKVERKRPQFPWSF